MYLACLTGCPVDRKDVMEEVLEDNRFLSEKALAGLQRHLERNKSNGVT